MAKVVITVTADQIKLVFNDNATRIGIVQTYINKNSIEEVAFMVEGYVMLHVRGSHYTFSYDGSTGDKVDTIGGVAITSNGQLCDLIGALIK